MADTVTETKPKRWYIVHAYSNFENKVADSIREQAKQRGLSHLFDEIMVPTEKVVEVRRGRKVDAERKFFPGYVLVKMDLTDEAYHLIKNTPKVTGFLGADKKPMPISEVRGPAHHEPGAGRHRAAEALDLVRGRRAGARVRRPVRVVQRHGGGSRRGALARSRSRCRSSAAPRRSSSNSDRSRSFERGCARAPHRALRALSLSAGHDCQPGLPAYRAPPARRDARTADAAAGVRLARRVSPTGRSGSRTRSAIRVTSISPSSRAGDGRRIRHEPARKSSRSAPSMGARRSISPSTPAPIFLFSRSIFPPRRRRNSRSRRASGRSSTSPARGAISRTPRPEWAADARRITQLYGDSSTLRLLGSSRPRRARLRGWLARL